MTLLLLAGILFAASAVALAHAFVRIPEAVPDARPDGCCHVHPLVEEVPVTHR